MAANEETWKETENLLPGALVGMKHGGAELYHFSKRLEVASGGEKYESRGGKTLLKIKALILFPVMVKGSHLFTGNFHRRYASNCKGSLWHRL